MDHVYFPVTAVLGFLVLMESGDAAEVATIGSEGMAGVGILVSDTTNPYRLITQVDGDCFRIPAAVCKRLIAECPCLREVVLRYAIILLEQSGQNAACNLHHTLEERVSRWLLATADRVARSEFPVTQEFLSEVLGVHRQSVNITARLLQQAGLISYQRGYLRILDREGLEQTACECFRLTKETYRRIMGVACR
jgi:CRP-like cAMP-binding protein